MFPQSRKITTRSAMSAGGSWKTSSSGRNRYSTGSGNSFAARNITESLPSASRMRCMASSEPSASPSGFSWVVSRNRSPARIASATRSISLVNELGRFAHSSRRRVMRSPRSTLSSYSKVRVGFASCASARDLALQHTVGRAQAGKGALPLLLGAEHADVDARSTQVWGSVHGSHGHKSDSRVLSSVAIASPRISLIDSLTRRIRAVGIARRR